MSKIIVAIHTYKYQKRLCWMLSSILQQVDIPKDSIEVDISYTNDEPDGNPTTQQVINFFRNKGLTIHETRVAISEIPNRSIARNRQVKRAIERHHNNGVTHILFADSDMVYSCDFFSDLLKKLDNEYLQETKVMGADRVSLRAENCISYFDSENHPFDYPMEIPEVDMLASKIPAWRTTGGEVAPGNFQLASIESIISHGGVYTKRSNDLWRRTRSDRGFRCQLGGRVKIETKPQYHLNHGRELGIQR